MVSQQLEFRDRLERLLRKHRAMARGYTTRMRPDGLIVARPRRHIAPISGRSVLIFLAAFLCFKAFLMASLGNEVYDERLAHLQLGTVVERVGALAMQHEPLSDALAAAIGPLVR